MRHLSNILSTVNLVARHTTEWPLFGVASFMAEQMLCFREGLFAKLALPVKCFPGATWCFFTASSG